LLRLSTRRGQTNGRINVIQPPLANANCCNAQQGVSHVAAAEKPVWSEQASLSFVEKAQQNPPGRGNPGEPARADRGLPTGVRSRVGQQPSRRPAKSARDGDLLGVVLEFG